MENRDCVCGKCEYKIKEECMKERKKAYKVVVGIIFLIAVIATGMAVKSRTLGFINKIGGDSKIPNLYYVKDDTAYGVNLSNLESTPKEFGTDENMAEVFFGAIELRLWGEEGFLNNSFKPDLMSRDGKYHFFIKNVKEDEDTYTLYYSKKGEQVIIDSDIEVHELVADNRIVYRKNGNLYLNDLERTVKIGQNISRFYLNKEKTKILWGEVNSEDNYCDYYIQNLGEKSQKHKIADNCEIIEWTTDFSKILMSGNMGYFIVENQNKMKEIDSKGGCVWSDLEKERLLFAKHVYGSDTTKFTVWEKGEGESFAVTTGEGWAYYSYDEKEETIYMSTRERGVISIACSKKNRGDVKEINIHAGSVWNRKLIQDEEGKKTRFYYVVDGLNGEPDQLFCNERLLCSGEDIELDLIEKNEGPVWGTQKESLFKLKGTELESIANQVTIKFLQVIEGEKVLFLKNYDDEKKCGDLIYYDGQNLQFIDTGVEEFLFWDTKG